jgi:hypothetical protein
VEVTAAVDERLINRPPRSGYLRSTRRRPQAPVTRYVTRSGINRRKPQLDLTLAAAEEVRLCVKAQAESPRRNELSKLIVGSLDSRRPERPPVSAGQLGAAGVQIAMRLRSGLRKRTYLHGPMLGVPEGPFRPSRPASVDQPTPLSIPQDIRTALRSNPNASHAMRVKSEGWAQSGGVMK